MTITEIERPVTRTDHPPETRPPGPPLIWVDEDVVEAPRPTTSWLARFAAAKWLGGW